MEKLIVKSTNKKGKVKERSFTEKQAAQALIFLTKELTKGNYIERWIVKDGNNTTK